MQVGGVGGRQIVRDDDRARRRYGGGLVLAEQVAQDAIADEVDVGAALAEVVFFDRVEDGLDLFDRLAQRPLGVDLVLADAAARGLDHVLVVQHEQVRVEDQEVVLAFALGQLALDALELLAGHAQRFVEAADLGLDLLVGDVPLGRLDPAAIDHVGAPHRQPRRRSHANHHLRCVAH